MSEGLRAFNKGWELGAMTERKAIRKKLKQISPIEIAQGKALPYDEVMKALEG